MTSSTAAFLHNTVLIRLGTMATPFQSPSTRRGRSHGSAVRDDRKVLFQDAKSSGSGGYSSRRKKTGPSSTASEAQSIQQSLHRTQNLLKNELDRVSQVATAIDEDGKLLEDTKNEYQSLNVSGAKKALTSLQRAQQQEQRVLMASVVFFFLVVFYIMWERVLIKLPFVDRIVKLVLAVCRQFLGETMSQINVGLKLAIVWGEEAMSVALEKGQEFVQYIQTQIERNM